MRDMELVTLETLKKSATKRKDMLEQLAAFTVAQTTGVLAWNLDPGGGRNQLPDFQLTECDESRLDVGVLEVTSDTNSDAARFGARVGKLDWRSPMLSWLWSVHTDGRTPPNELRKALAPELKKLEDANLVDEWLRLDTLPGILDSRYVLPHELFGLGVMRVRAVYPDNNPQGGFIAVQMKQVPSGSVSAEYALRILTQTVETQVSKQDNLFKLTNKSHQRAELFIWLDLSYMSVALAATNYTLGRVVESIAVPKIPNGVTAVWVAAPSQRWNDQLSFLLRVDGDRWVSASPLSFDGEK